MHSSVDLVSVGAYFSFSINLRNAEMNIFFINLLGCFSAPAIVSVGHMLLQTDK